MVSCAGLQHGNERTLGYLRIASDERPLALQIFGSEPAVMAGAARMVEEAGATMLDEPERGCRVVEAVASAVSVPVTVKLRRGLENGSRACLSIGPRLVEVGEASLTLHPRSDKQMYT